MRSVNKKSGETRYEYYGVLLAPGPNLVEVTPLGANEMRGPTEHYTLYGPGKPAHFAFAIDKPIHADGGATFETLSITATDRWNNPAVPGAIIKLGVVSGDLHFLVATAPAPGQPPVYHETSALEMPVSPGGLTQIRVIAGLLPGEALVQATAADLVAIDRFYIQPNLRKPFVAGLVTVGAGPVPGL